jgi:hypothetical protein
LVKIAITNRLGRTLCWLPTEIAGRTVVGKVFVFACFMAIALGAVAGFAMPG